MLELGFWTRYCIDHHEVNLNTMHYEKGIEEMNKNSAVL